MIPRARGAARVVVVAITLGLVACTPTNNSHPTPTPTPQARLTIPSVRVPVRCADLFSTAEASRLVGYAVTVKADEATTPTDISSIAARQNGTLVCIWGGTDGAGELAGYAEQLEIDVAVDAKAAYETNVSPLAAAEPPMYVNTAGDESSTGCEDLDYFFGCGGNMLVGNYWVSIDLINDTDATVTAPVAEARDQQVLTTVAAALVGTHPRSGWHAPASTLPTLCSSPDSRVKLQKVLGAARLSPEPYQQTAANAFYLAESGPDVVSCQWRESHLKTADVALFDEVDFEVLRGGAWALPALVDSPHSDLTYGVYRPVHLAGSNSTVVNSCAPGCSAIAAVKGNLVEIGLQPVLNTKFVGPSREKTLKVLAALVAALNAS